MTDKRPASSLPLLEYGPAAPRRLPRWARILIAAVALLATAVLLLYSFAQPYVQQADALWRQRRLMNWTWPADKIIYTEDQSRTAALINGGGYVPDEYGTNPNDSEPVPRDWPRGITLEEHSELIAGPLHMQFSTLFRHYLRSPGGNERLVDLGISAFARNDHERVLMITQRASTLMTWSPGSRPQNHSYMGFALLLTPSDRLTLFAGQADPADAAHLTVPYELNGQRGTIDGWLRDDNSISMKVRDGPAQPAPQHWWFATPATSPSAAGASLFDRGRTR